MRAKPLMFIVAAGALLALSACAGDTQPASHVKATQAQLNARGHTDKGPATWWWEYSTSQQALLAGQGTQVCGVGTGPKEPDKRCGPGEAATDVDLNVVVGGLSPSTDYYFRACGQDVGGSAICGNARTFFTSAGDSTVSVQQGIDGKRIVFTAAPGTKNHFSLTRDVLPDGTAVFVIRDGFAHVGGSTLIPGSGCTLGDTSVYDDNVRCPAAGVVLVNAKLGDRDDFAEIDPDIGIRTALEGGPGDDELFGGKFQDTLSGGSGVDRFNGFGASDTILARNQDVDGDIVCGESPNDNDKVTADPADPVTASASTCETVDK
jgi:hypothetical protein